MFPEGISTLYGIMALVFASMRIFSRQLVILPEFQIQIQILFTHETLRSSEARSNVFVRSRFNWNLEVLVFEERGKL